MSPANIRMRRNTGPTAKWTAAQSRIYTLSCMEVYKREIGKVLTRFRDNRRTTTL